MSRTPSGRDRVFRKHTEDHMQRIARFTLEGVKDAEVSLHPYATEDGLGLDLRRFRRADCDDVVLLVHGLTSSSDMFIMPEHTNLVTFLLDAGFTDVWTS